MTEVAPTQATLRGDGAAGTSRPADARRSILAEAIIALAVCGGAALMLVEPIERRLSEANANLSDLRTRAAEAAQRLDTPKALAAISAVKAHADEVTAASRFALDEGALLARVSELARAHGLRLDEMQPGAMRDQRPTGGKAPIPGETRSGYTFRLVGTFEATAALLADLEHQTGFTAVRSVRLSPISEPGTRELQVFIETEHFAFVPAGRGAASRMPSNTTAGVTPQEAGQ